MSFPAGWYDDPQDPSSQRYWDGGFWTDYRRARLAPVAYPGHGGGFGYPSVVPSTPDGVALAGWWTRVVARFLDGLIVSVAGLPLTGYFLFRYFEVVADFQRQVLRDATAGETGFNLTLPWEAYKWAIPATVIALVLGLAYEYLFLTRTGATPGKRVVGISVRLREVVGPPPGLAVAKRAGLYAGIGAMGVIPVVGSVFGIFGLLNHLWPLWDAKKQALHDKVAATNVVMGAQPRHLG